MKPASSILLEQIHNRPTTEIYTLDISQNIRAGALGSAAAPTIEGILSRLYPSLWAGELLHQRLTSRHLTILFADCEHHDFLYKVMVNRSE